MILSKKQITKALISLRGGWSAPLLFAVPEDRFSRVEDQIIKRYARDCSFSLVVEVVGLEPYLYPLHNSVMQVAKALIKLFAPWEFFLCFFAVC